MNTKEKSYGSGGFLNLGGLLSGSRGVGDRSSLSRLSLLHSDNGSGNSFGGRHYNNRDRDELTKATGEKSERDDERMENATNEEVL